MYRLKVEFTNGVVMYYKHLTFKEVIETMAKTGGFAKINIWCKIPNEEKK